MSNLFSSIGSAIERIFTIPGRGSPAPAAPAAAPVVNFTVPTPTPPAPLPAPAPVSTPVQAAQQQAAQTALGTAPFQAPILTRQGTILTTSANRTILSGANRSGTIGGGGSTAGALYAAATLGGSQ